MDKKFEYAVDFIFKVEGGYSNHSKDQPTNMGITQTTYNQYRRAKKLGIKNVKLITKEEAKNIYYEFYWLPSGASKCKNPKLALAYFDGEVQHGHADNSKLVQQGGSSLSTYIEARQKFYSQAKNRDVFGEGWKNRINELKNEVSQGAVPSSKAVVSKPSASKVQDAKKDGEPKRNFLQQLKYEQDNKMAAFKDRLLSSANKEYMDSSLEKRFHGEIPKGYVNEASGKNEIFTREQLEKMEPKEKELKKKAINYQKKTIGVPSEKEAKETVSKGGMVYVESYQRADGTKVRGYYRSK